MNHSFYSVDRTTHLKIVAIALVAATAVSVLGIAAHSRKDDGMAQTERVIVKTQKSAMLASNLELAAR
jgi:hypothetical protein